MLVSVYIWCLILGTLEIMRSLLGILGATLPPKTGFFQKITAHWWKVANNGIISV